MADTVLITGASSGLGLEFARIFASRGCDLILTARSEEKLREMSLTTNQVARKFIRFMLGSAVEGGLDKQGRILLPQPLKAYAGLDKEVVLVGVMDRIEVWDKDKWEQNQAHDEPNIELLASEMEEMGLSI